MGYSLDFGWLTEALGAIAQGAAMTILLIAVTTLAGTVAQHPRRGRPAQRLPPAAAGDQPSMSS